MTLFGLFYKNNASTTQPVMHEGSDPRLEEHTVGNKPQSEGSAVTQNWQGTGQLLLPRL